MVEVVKACHAGACYGVQRALDMALNAAKRDEDVKSLGPLIHNPQVVAHLEESGVGVADSLEEVHGGTIIIRSHGIGPAMRKSLTETGARIVDATCPHVYRAQRAAADLARSCGTVIVVGDEKHPEVEGLRAYAEDAGGKVLVIGAADQVPADLPKKVGVVVQTTQSEDLLQSVLRAIEAQGVEVELENTICSATTKRQEAAADLAGQVEAIVVIGGHNSSNTTRLYEICKASCPKTFHVETVDELDPEAFAGCRKVGVTAGASTPEDLIAEVVEYLQAL